MSNGSKDQNPFILGATNPQDPTLSVQTRNVRELFSQIARLCTGFSNEDIVEVGANLIINALRQGFPKRKQALDAYSELINKTGTLLAQHYDAVTGNRRNIFPHTQVIQADHLIDPDKQRN